MTIAVDRNPVPKENIQYPYVGYSADAGWTVLVLSQWQGILLASDKGSIFTIGDRVSLSYKYEPLESITIRNV